VSPWSVGRLIFLFLVAAKAERLPSASGTTSYGAMSRRMLQGLTRAAA